MTNNFKPTKNALAKLNQDMEAFSSLAKPSYLSRIAETELALASTYRQQLEITRALDISRITAQIKAITSAQQHWQEMLKQTNVTNQIAESFAATHKSWLEHITPIKSGFSQLAQLSASTKQALFDASLQLRASERLMSNIDFNAIQSHFRVEIPVIAGVESSIALAAASYEGLAESMPEISDITRLPDFILPGATREIYTTSFALDTLCPRREQDEKDTVTEVQIAIEAELETSGCIALLQQLDPALARPYMGAREALSSNNVDRVRHILSSLRELWNHILWQLAPNNLVADWITGFTNQKDLLHEGKPTRKARVLYICRELNSDPLTDFLVHDTRALVKLIELFNRVHELETKLSDEQLRAILLRTESWLMYILQISAGNFQKQPKIHNRPLT